MVSGCSGTPLRGTGDLGLIIERADSSALIVDSSNRQRLARVHGLGDLSHASVVFSRDERYAFVFGRDGGLSKVDMLKAKVVARVIQAGNAIGGAISQDGSLVAVSNYEPGGVRIFDTGTLELVADLPTQSKVIGLVDAPGQLFVFALYDSDEIWVADMSNPEEPAITKFTDIGHQPYDGLITPDGRTYISGLFGEDGMAMLDLWHLEKGVTRILDNYGRGEEKLPVYKMPHLEGWAVAGGYAFMPAVGHHEVLVVDMTTWKQVARIPVHGQPVFVMARPDGRQVWVNFAVPRNDTVQVIDAETMKLVKTLTPGKGVLHMEFTPRGEEVWLSVRDLDVVKVYDTKTAEVIKELPALKPSGIFFTARAHKTGL
ncbi:MAG: protein nirF [Rhodospirillaceae bacterium]|nr:protein nirF [Rhodospirillaceae bacterium]MBT5243479.1 protein nirF [Rhodospirillaceae bacterium]MBT5562067.1 protein nirF [Rhodospirillaceae bacterium]MBT6242240.1 protein nirF [Rhodospirillaceae bacterium]MBT7136272.1 protein nirF [Rhodospirillaceae bacterium]